MIIYLWGFAYLFTKWPCLAHARFFPIMRDRFYLRNRLFWVSLVVSILFVSTFIPGASWAVSLEKSPSAESVLPRFVSIKASRANLRQGPGRNYAIIVTYQKQGLPLEIMREYDQWRKVRDSEGTEGWMLKSLLSSRRTALVTPWQQDKQQLVPLYKSSSMTGALVAQLEPNVLASINQCDGKICRLTVDGRRGYAEQSLLWGVYPNEVINPR